MSITINLRIKKKHDMDWQNTRRLVTSGSMLFIFFLLILGGIEYGYWQYLTNKSNELASDIATNKDRIRALKDIEEQKSLVTVKTTKLQELFTKRFNYVAALNDVTNLFSNTIDIRTIAINESGECTVDAKKSQELRIDPMYKLTSTIKTLRLTLTIASSDELQEIIRNITTFQAQGLASASVGKLVRLEDGSYQTDLTLNFNPSISQPPERSIQ